MVAKRQKQTHCKKYYFALRSTIYPPQQSQYPWHLPGVLCSIGTVYATTNLAPDGSALGATWQFQRDYRLVTPLALPYPETPLAVYTAETLGFAHR